MAAASGIDGIIEPQKIVKAFGDKFSSVTGSWQQSLSTPSSTSGTQTSLFSITDVKYPVRNLKSGTGHDGIHSNHLKFLNERHVGHI